MLLKLSPFAFSNIPQDVRVRLTSSDCEGKAMHVSTLSSSLDFKQTWHSVTACLGLLTCRKMDPFPHSFKLEGMAWHWRIEWYFTLLSVYLLSCMSPVYEKAKHPHTWISTSIFQYRLHALLSSRVVPALLRMKMICSVKLSSVGCTVVAQCFNLADLWAEQVWRSSPRQGFKMK